MTNQGVTVTVLYPRTEDYTFNESYYTSTHLALCEKVWANHGLKSWHVSKLSDDAPYTYQATILFESPEALAGALADPGTQEIMTDAPNYTNTKAVLLRGGIIAKSS